MISTFLYLQEDQEKKRLEQLQKKQEAKALLEKEMESIKIVKAAPPPPKITRAQINQMKERTIKPEPPIPVVNILLLTSKSFLLGRGWNV